MVARIGEAECELVMSGGEFCGNACRAAAMFMQSNFGIADSIIKINGLLVKAFCDGKRSIITLANRDLIQSLKTLETGLFLVKQTDMTQIVVTQNSRFYKTNSTKEYALMLKEKFKLDDLAVGIIFFDGESQIPFIWGKKS